MPNPGDVLFHSRFRFSDSTVGRKLLIVLNSTDLTAHCLVLKTTSNDRFYQGSKQGCNPEKRVFFIPKEWQHFDEDTFVQIPQIFPIPIAELIRNGMQKVIITIFTLDQNCFSQLLNCLKKHFKDDISEENRSLIFSKSE